MTDSQVLEQYVRLIPFLATVLGPGCEVLIHDTRNPKHSIIAIRNNLSGRQLDDPMTDLALNIAERGEYENADYVANYSGRSKGKDFLSSTYFIKNEGRLIGLLCVNKEMSAVQDLNNALRMVLERYELAIPQESEYSETLDSSISNLLHTSVAEAIAQSGLSPARMTMQEKVAVVHQLNDSGVLMMKGAVSEIARQLQVSEPTVYRYIKTPLDWNSGK